ncbi:MAG: hypothetical protein IIC93_11200 [Chloroflexi bacterium]|nr:hypothetical protein [Chloroflexota bacterium]
MPTRELREATIYACGELADIQLDHASECPEPNRRNVSEAAQEEIRGVVAVLDEAFGNVGLAPPYAVQEEPVE